MDQKRKKYRLIQNVFYVYQGVAKHKPYLIGLLVLAIFCSAGSKFLWLFLGKYLVEFIDQGIPFEELIRLVALLTAGNILCMIGQNAVSFGKEPAAFYVRPMFMLGRNKKSIALFYENLENRKVLDLLEKSKEATRNVDVGIEGIIRFTIDLCTHIFTCFLAVVLLCQVNILMAVGVLLIGLLTYLSVDHATKKEKRLTNDEVLHEKRKLEHFKKVSTDFAYGKDIRLFQLSGTLLSTQEGLQKTLNQKVRKARLTWLGSDLLGNFLELLREGGLYTMLIYMILTGQLGIGDFVLYAGCVRNLAEALQILMRTFAKLRKCSAEVNDYRAYNEFCDAQSGGEEKLPAAKEYTVTFENVSFKYPGREDYALRNLNLTLPFGEKLAVVGLNGAGKTTFVKLLLKLYQPTEGRILLGGVDLRKIDTEEYYALFAPVFQDLELYAFSLAENVSMKTREATDFGRAKECLERAGLGEKLKEWPKGIETPMLRILHDDGILLSGGEKQKMALARALYKDAPIVVLDEPTAALDALSESEIYERFDSFVRGKSAVYVSHRLASTRFCDRIVMFENGELVECGSHEELMELGGKYAHMFELQAKYYQEENDETVAC